MANAAYPNYLDTSALIKLFLDEQGSDVIRRYVSEPRAFFTSSLCLGETLGVLKAKNRRGEIRDDVYYHFCSDFMARVSQGLIKVEDVGITKWEIFSEVLSVAKVSLLDVSDAFLIVTLKRGFFAKFADPSKPLFITADEKLASVARAQQLNVWDCLRERAPSSVNVWDCEILS